MKRAAFDPDAVPEAALYFNQASPSAYVRGNTRAVPLALSLMRSLELGGARVLNGSRAFLLELSKSAQAALLRSLDIPHPRSLAFNDPESALAQWAGGWPALLKPEQGGSGARMFLLHSGEELAEAAAGTTFAVAARPSFAAARVFSRRSGAGNCTHGISGRASCYTRCVWFRHGAFNLCPSEECNPEGGGESRCAIPEAGASKAGGVLSLQDVPAAAVEMGEKIMAAGGLDVGGIEYLEAADGRRIFYDVNANSNLRGPIGQAFGFDPFERVVDFLAGQISNLTGHIVTVRDSQ